MDFPGPLDQHGQRMAKLLVTLAAITGETTISRQSIRREWAQRYPHLRTGRRPANTITEYGRRGLRQLFRHGFITRGETSISILNMAALREVAAMSTEPPSSVRASAEADDR